MAVTEKPNIGADLVRLHRVVTRGREISMHYCQSFDATGFSDLEIREGFLNYIQSLSSMLHGHHSTENELAFPAFREKFAEHTQKHSGSDYLVIPFILYNLSAEDRKFMSQHMPPIVTEQLVPIRWKDKWSSMKQFLLS